MANFDNIIQEINTNLPDNTTQAITAAKLRTTLVDLTNQIDSVQDDFETNITNTIDNFIDTYQPTTVIDNLDSESSTDALSAKQGKILGDEIFYDSEIDLIQTAEILSSTIIDVNGELTSNTSYSVYKISNQNYTRLTGQASSNTYRNKYYLIAFYNGEPSTSTFISGIKPTVSNTEEAFDTTVPSGTVYILVSRYSNKTTECNTIINISKIEDLENTVDDYSSQISTISETANTAITKANYCEEVVDDFVIKNEPIVKTVADDFTISGRYSDSNTDIVSGNWISCPLVSVNEGEKIYFHNWRAYPDSLPFCWLYDNDGIPYAGAGTNARVTSNNPEFILISESESGNEYEYTIPTNGGLIGLAVPTAVGVNPPGASVSIGDEYYEFTDEAVDMINSVVDGDIESTGDRTANYYLKGNVYIPVSNKKLGIIAAGQSNIDGRNSYSDYPYLSTNPNPKVHFCNNTNGTFSSFEVVDGGANNDWSFDAIVYNLLTETSHGNQDEIYVMKKSMGGTSIDLYGATNYHWTADYEYLTSSTYSLLLDFEKTIRNGVSTQGTNFEINAFLWHQGEGDTVSADVANRYYENLKNMLAYVRGVVGNPKLNFFCGNLSMNRPNNTYVPIINTAYAQLESEDPYFHCVDMSNAILEDNYHFNYQWSIYFGQKVYDMMIDAGIISGTKVNPSEPV